MRCTPAFGRAEARQLKNPRYGLTHNLGGFPHQNVCAISIVGATNINRESKRGIDMLARLRFFLLKTRS